ncbi:MAG TPA: tyrosine-type recombinase/integrase [Gammaproteobacteria bacterium]|nr:tyrosine-type recombinase/integrase [Gammaproteobacteria bacterium]
MREPDRWVGRWREDVELGDGTIKRVRRWEVLAPARGVTKPMAQRLLEKRLAEVNREDYRPARAESFAAFAARWETDVLAQHKPSTQRSERSVIRVHLKPAFGEWQPREISCEALQRWVAAAQLEPKSIRNVVATLKTMWRQVRAWGYAQHDPFDGLRLPAVVKGANTYYFTPEQMVAIVNAASGWKRLFLGILGETAMRPGELAGLRREDVRGRMLLVRQSVWQRQVQTPKTANAVRAFRISARCAELLEEHLKTARPNPGGLVFAAETGRPLSMDNFRHRVLEPILKKLGIATEKRCGLYAFRHGNMTELSRAGTPLKTIQKRAGHAAGSEVTAEHYLHAVDLDDDAAAEYMGALIWPKDGATVQ